jgi:hypothetical protein
MPIAVVAFGWWLIGSPLPDDHDRIFVTRTLLLVLTSAVVVTLRLPLVVRLAVLLVLPFADPVMSDGLIGGYQTWWTYLHHVDVAVATALYVSGPDLLRRLRRASTSLDPVGAAS